MYAFIRKENSFMVPFLVPVMRRMLMTILSKRKENVGKLKLKEFSGSCFNVHVIFALLLPAMQVYTACATNEFWLPDMTVIRECLCFLLECRIAKKDIHPTPTKIRKEEESTTLDKECELPCQSGKVLGYNNTTAQQHVTSPFCSCSRIPMKMDYCMNKHIVPVMCPTVHVILTGAIETER